MIPSRTSPLKGFMTIAAVLTRSRAGEHPLSARSLNNENKLRIGTNCSAS